MFNIIDLGSPIEKVYSDLVSTTGGADVITDTEDTLFGRLHYSHHIRRSRSRDGQPPSTSPTATTWFPLPPKRSLESMGFRQRMWAFRELRYST